MGISLITEKNCQSKKKTDNRGSPSYGKSCARKKEKSSMGAFVTMEKTLSE
jgi:hypothetical protein